MSELDRIRQIDTEVKEELARADYVIEKLRVAVDRAGKIIYASVKTELLAGALDVLEQQKAEIESLRQSRGD